MEELYESHPDEDMATALQICQPTIVSSAGLSPAARFAAGRWTLRTAFVDGHVTEGQVPMADARCQLTERPIKARGLMLCTDGGTGRCP